MSPKALTELTKRNGIERIEQGKFTYVPKAEIDKLFKKLGNDEGYFEKKNDQ